MQFLLDTNVCVGYLRGDARVVRRLTAEDIVSCAISVITVAELTYGAELARDPVAAATLVRGFVAPLQEYPLAPVIPEYARQKARLRRSGQIIEDFDLLIGATAVVYGLTLVTNNTKHLARLDGIALADWTV